MTKLVLLGRTTTNDVMTYGFDRTPAFLLSPLSNLAIFESQERKYIGR